MLKQTKKIIGLCSHRKLRVRIKAIPYWNRDVLALFYLLKGIGEL